MVNSPIVPAGAQLSTKSVDQGSQAGDLLGIALLINKDPKVPAVDDQQRDTVLTALRDTGFITYGADRVGAANTALIVTGGGLGDDAGEIEGQSVSVILTDPAGLVLSRLTGDGEFDRHLDRVRLAPGFSYAEKFVGTNGIGTALEVGGPADVFGHGHYAENLEKLACAGVPIHHPISGRLVGAVDLTCWRRG